LFPHRLLRRRAGRRRIAARLHRDAVLVPARRYVQINVFHLLIGHIRLAEVARVGADLLRLLFQIRRDQRNHRQQLLFVVRLLRNLGGNDHLRRGIDRDLRIVALYKAALVGAVRHDAALRIGEVALRDIDSEEVIRRVHEIGPPRDQLFLLRQWALHARTRVGLFTVASYALDLAIKTTEYTPTATDFRELAEVFRRLSNSGEILELVNRFDAQRAAIEKVGPTADFVYLQLLLTLGQSHIDVRAAGNRLVDVFATVSQMSDLATKSGCLARLLDMMPLIDPTNEIRNREGIETLSL